MHIKQEAYIEKAKKLAEGEVEFVVSTNAWDAHGERIDVNGISYKEYMKNPVVLWGHDGFNLPIGKTVKLWKEGNKLMARAKFYLKDEFARKVYDYIVDGYLNAVSIGGMVEEWGSDNLTIAKLNMKEFSVVSIPANPEALATAKSFNDTQVTELKALANRYARKRLEASDGGQLTRDIDVLENVVATLKELALPSETDEKQAKADKLRVVLRQAQTVDKHAEKTIKTVKVTLKGLETNE